MSAAVVVAAAAHIQAVRSMGVVIEVRPDDFVEAIAETKHSDLTVVHSCQGFFTSHHHYLVSIGGLALHTKSFDPLKLAEEKIDIVVEAEQISVP